MSLNFKTCLATLHPPHKKMTSALESEVCVEFCLFGNIVRVLKISLLELNLLAM